MYDAVLNGGSTIISLQPKPIDQQNRSFYAYGEHRPPPIAARPSTATRRPGSMKATSKKQSYNTQATESYCLNKQNKRSSNLQGVSFGTLKRQTMQPSSVPRTVQPSLLRHRGDKHSKVAQLKRLTKEAASPMLSDYRLNRSHFGVSTQMMIDDGSVSHVVYDQTPQLRPDATNFSPPNIKQFNNRLNNGILQARPLTGKHSVPIVRNHQEVTQQPHVKTFFRQNTIEFKPGHVGVEQSQNSFGERNKRSSLASDTVHWQNAVNRDQPIENHVNSAAQLQAHQENKIFDHFKDSGQATTQDQLSELRKMELNIGNLNLAAQFKSSLYNSQQEENTNNVYNTAMVPSMNMPASPTLNVVIPSGLNTAFQEPLINTKKTQDVKRRPKTAQNRGAVVQKNINTVQQKRRILTGQKRLNQADSVATSSMIVMNEKKMSVAAGTTTKGIVSLYNKGFVPKKTGMYSRATKFATASRQLYSTVNESGAEYLKSNQPATSAGGWFTTKDSNYDKVSFSQMNSCTDTGRFPAASSSDHTSLKRIETMHDQVDYSTAAAAAVEQQQQRALRLPPKRPRSKNRQQKKEPALGGGLTRSGTRPGTAAANKESRLVQSNSESSCNRVINYSTYDRSRGGVHPLQQYEKQPSEVVLGSVENYGSERHTIENDQADVIEKGVFKLPSTQEVQKRGLKKQSGMSSAEFANSGQGTNEEQDSREMTDNEDVMQPINLLEKIASTDQSQHREGGFLIASNQQFQAQIERERSKMQERKSVHTKRSFSRKTERILEQTLEASPFESIGNDQVSIRIDNSKSSKPSGKTTQYLPLNRDKSQEVADVHSALNELSKPASLKNLTNNNSSYVLSKVPVTKSPDETSQSLVGSLQSRPLIGSQLVKNLARMHSGFASKQSLPNQQQQQLVQSQRHVISKSHLGGNAQILMQVSSTNQVKLMEQEPFFGSDSIMPKNMAPNQGGALTPTANPSTTFVNMTSAINDYRGQGATDPIKVEQDQLKTLEQTLLIAKIGKINDKSRPGQRSAFVLSELRAQKAETYEQLGMQQLNGLQVPGGVRNSTTDRQSASQQQPLVSGISSHTQVDVSGKVKHLFLINNTTRGDSSKNLKVPKSKDVQTRRRRKRTRPATSRINKRSRGLLCFDLINEQASNGEDIATVMGGSTSRNNQMSHRDLLNRRNSGYTTAVAVGANDIINQQITSLPNLRIHANEFFTDNTNGSQVPNFPSSNNVLVSSIAPSQRPIMARNFDSGDSLPADNNVTIKEQDQLLQQLLRNNNEFGSDDLPETGQESPELNDKALTMPAEGGYQYSRTLDSQPINHLKQESPLRQQLAGGRHEFGVHNSINDYLRNEDIRGIQILDVTKSALIDSHIFTVADAKQSQPVSQVTIYKEPKGEDKDDYMQNVNTSQPTTVNQIPVNAMYSHMSQQRGTGSVESPCNMITDPRLSTPIGNLFALLKPEHHADGTKILIKGGQQDSGSGIIDPRMKVVTNIRSKNSSKERQDESVITMDFNQQVDVQLLTSDGESPVPEHMPREMSQLMQAPSFVSAYKMASSGGGYLSSPQSVHAMLPIGSDLSPHQRTPGLEQKVIMSPDSILLQDTSQNFFFINSEGVTAPPMQRMDLSGTIRKSQEFLRHIQMTKNAPVRNKARKQDDLLILKERQVIPLSVATVPEKTQYQKHLYSNGGDPGIAIVGRTTHTITKTQYKNYVEQQKKSLSPPPPQQKQYEPTITEKEPSVVNQRTTGTSPVNFGLVRRLGPLPNTSERQQPPYGNLYDARYRVDRHASETQVQTVGCGVDAETMRSHIQPRDDLDTTQLLPMQSREKSFVSSLIRDDLQFTPSQSAL